ncbi:threonine aspartase 1-like isoform X2 [Paramacrobiotus metropolitanus]|uniref:threonine aspartase 1-like isoform X2 n=1 Tax=Paramacrobiotus metropolitanus TaxID=2943436 RepID=UPI0024464D0B|nr:threonine aspartase 1-like isoform X2 [Paramacrobiotus metropolitanus]
MGMEKTVAIQSAKAFVAVHCGAGFYASHNNSLFISLCRSVCSEVLRTLENGSSAVEAVCAAVVALENNPLTNAGVGSNLTRDGTVECDASVMESSNNLFGACGAVKGVKNPVLLAREILHQQMSPRDGLVAPMIFVGDGAVQFAKSQNVETVDLSFHQTEPRLKKYNEKKRSLHCVDTSTASGAPNDAESELDTVGAIVVDMHGVIAVASSSGGVAFKYSGRIGQAATYGAGIWCETVGADGFACCVSGTGEQIIQTSLAKAFCDALQQDDVSLESEVSSAFLNSKRITGCHPRYMGALVLQVSDWLQSAKGFLHVVHTTPGFCWAMASSNRKNPQAQLSRLLLPRDASSSTNVQSVAVLGYSV